MNPRVVAVADPNNKGFARLAVATAAEMVLSVVAERLCVGRMRKL